MKTVNVYLPRQTIGNRHYFRRLIDTVFFDDDCDLEYIRTSLINHDGYPPSIVCEIEN